jgi:hypothetical protein
MPLAIGREREEDHWYDDQHRIGRDDAVLRADLGAAEEAGDPDRERLGIGAGEEEREEVLVPRDDEHEYGERDDARAHHGKRHAPEQPPGRAAVDDAGLLELARDRGEKADQHPCGEWDVNGEIASRSPNREPDRPRFTKIRNIGRASTT